MPSRKYKLLIVDDSKSILHTLGRVFADTPYDVTTIDNPVKAYDKIENEHFDIVISDIMMPELDGLSLLRKIKDFNGTIQVIMITGYLTINNTINAFRYGANDIYFKPFDDMDELVKAVDAAASKLDRINEILKMLASEKKK
ncbi:MAG: response regulator [Desulfobulbaceae bacterium]|nr:response regulator [Desulfobulbaceae bacterium]HIJ79979.1 response regulator [Deltaproteobacteria bacterium]